MRGVVLFAAACVIAVALIGAVGWAFTDSAGHRAMLVSAGLAVAVQVVTFSVARLTARKNPMLGWGVGSLLRLLALVLYAVVVAKLTGGALVPALLSFVAFLFVTTVFEPVFLKQ